MRRIDSLYEFVKDKDYVTTKDIVAFGLDKMIISEALQKGILFKVRNGLYSTNESFEDQLYIMQENNNIIYSNETALYLHGLTDRIPIKYSVSVLQGSSSNLLKQYKNIKKYYVPRENFELGMINIKTPYNNNVRVYDIDRTIVDIIRNVSRIDRQTYLQAIKYYIQSKNKNISKALGYAKTLKCFDKVKNIISLFAEV